MFVYNYYDSFYEAMLYYEFKIGICCVVLRGAACSCSMLVMYLFEVLTIP